MNSKELKDMIEDITDSGKSIFSFTTEVLDYIEKVKLMNFSCSAILRQYYMEVCLNLEFIRTLNLNGKSTFNDFGDQLPKIAESLDVEVGASILYLSHQKEYSKAFKKLSNIYITVLNESSDTKDNEAENVSSKESIDYSSIYGAIIFTVNRIMLLKKIAASGLTSEAFRNIRIKQRILNIYDNLNAIRIALRNSDLKIFGKKREYSGKFIVAAENTQEKLKKKEVNISRELYYRLSSPKSKNCKITLSKDQYSPSVKVLLRPSDKLQKIEIHLHPELKKTLALTETEQQIYLCLTK